MKRRAKAIRAEIERLADSRRRIEAGIPLAVLADKRSDSAFRQVSAQELTSIINALRWVLKERAYILG